MNRFLKTLLIWILIAVVPLNAVAATIGMSCGPGHQKAMERAMAQDASHAMHEDTGHHHEMTNKSVSHHASAMSAADVDSGAADEPAHSACSACSVFCVGAVAPPSVFASIPAFGGSEDVVISAAPPVTGFIPEGLRRPPRQISA
jgi:hypothetical protein